MLFPRLAHTKYETLTHAVPRASVSHVHRYQIQGQFWPLHFVPSPQPECGLGDVRKWTDGRFVPCAFELSYKKHWLNSIPRKYSPPVTCFWGWGRRINICQNEGLSRIWHSNKDVAFTLANVNFSRTATETPVTDFLKDFFEQDWNKLKYVMLLCLKRVPEKVYIWDFIYPSMLSGAPSELLTLKHKHTARGSGTKQLR